MKFNQLTVFLSKIQKITTTRVFISLGLILLLNACSVFNNNSILKTKITNVDDLTEWQARGKVLLRNDKEKISGYFFWHQEGNNFTLSLNTFLGINVLTLTSKNASSELTFDGKTYKGRDPERLIFNVTGNIIPVNTLPSWMLANIKQPTTSSNSNVSNIIYDNHKIKSFHYQTSHSQTWQVSYSSFTHVEQLLVPNKLNVQSVKHRIKLTINDWEFIR